MTRTLLGLLTLSLAVGCTPDDLAVEADVETFAQDKGKEKEQAPDDDKYVEEVEAYTVDVDRDDEKDKIRYRDGTEKQIVAQAGDGEITCGAGQDDCHERPIFPLGPRAMSSHNRLGADLTITSSQSISFGVARGVMLTAPDAEFFDAPGDISAVYIVANDTPLNSRPIADSLVIEFVDGTLYETESGAINGSYTFLD